MRMGIDVETDEERSLYYKFKNKRHKANKLMAKSEIVSFDKSDLTPNLLY